MNIILTEYQNTKEGKYNALSKARNDTIKICVRNGYKIITLYIPDRSIIATVIHMIFACVLAITGAGKNDNIVYQYPHNKAADKIVLKILNLGKKIKGYKIYVIIHDLNSIRSEDTSTNTIKNELSCFANTTKIICHNAAMADLFRTVKLKDKCRILGPFYYLYNKPMPKHEFKEKFTVVIAGNLSREKCGYIYRINAMKHVDFNLYGVGIKETELPMHVRYKGNFLPDELIENIEGNFGLVWDGDSCDTCSGIFGNYLKYNNPHKLSMYIVAGLPVIVWSKSAMADYVAENNIGVCIDKLSNLEQLKIKSDQYKDFLKSIAKIRTALITGSNLSAILKE